MRDSIYITLLVVFSIFSIHLTGQTIKILPAGNSITYDAYSGDTRPEGQKVGYRYRLYTLLDNAGYDVEFIGKRSTGWDSLGTTNSHHAGYGGIWDNQLAEIFEQGYSSSYGAWETSGPYLNTYQADIVLLHIGTNNVWGADYQTADDVERILDEVDDFESAYGKPVIVFVARIISHADGSCTGHYETNYFNNVVENMVDARKSSGDYVEMVDMQCGAGIDYYSEMRDEVHPQPSGYWKMATQWFNAIDNYNTTPVLNDIPDQTINEGESFSTVNLNTYISDVETPDNQIVWTWSPASPQFLNISISNGILTVTPKDPLWGGSEQITLTATDNGKVLTSLKKSVSDNIRFTINSVNDPPEITGQDSLQTNEDQDITLSLSDITVEDPDNTSADWTLNILSGTNYTFSGTTVTPAANFYGYLTVNISVSDLEDESASFPLKVKVNAVNDKPVITGFYTFSMTEDIPYTLNLSQLKVTDVDDTYPADFTLSISAGSNYTRSGNIITPSLNYNGQLTIPVSVNDGSISSDTYNITCNVSSVNDKPQITLPANRTVDEDSPYNETLVGTDVDASDVITISLVEKPDWLNLTSGTGNISGIPLNANVGSNKVIARVNDGHVNVDTTFYIQVNNVNDAPKFTTSPVTQVYEDDEYYYQITANDVDPGDVLTYSGGQIPGWLVFNKNTRILTGTPDNDAVGTHHCIINVSDGKVTVKQEFDIEVINVNDAPVIQLPINITAYEDVLYSQTVTASDPDDLTISLSAINIPAWLTFTPATGKLEGTPGHTNIGLHTFTIRANDGKVNADSILSIEVINTNDPPEFTSTPDTVSNIDELYSYEVTGYDEDPDEDLIVTIENLPGWLTFNSTTNTLSGTPAITDVGNHYVKISLYDGEVKVYQEFYIEVINNAANECPYFTSTPVDTATEDDTYRYVILAEDPNDDDLTFEIHTIPSWLQFIASSNLLIGTPRDEAVNGLNKVIILVKDAECTEKQEFDINVLNVNDAPEIIGQIQTIKTLKNEPVELKLEYLDVNDVDNVYPDDFSLKIEYGENYSFIGNIVTPLEGFTGPIYVNIRVNDGFIDSDESQVIVDVGPNNINDIKDDDASLTVYPNPVKSVLNIKNVSGKKIERIEIVNILGEVVINRIPENTANTININTGSLMPGIYYTRIFFSDNNIKIRKILHQ